VLVFGSGDSIVPHYTNIAILFIDWFVEGGQLHHFSFLVLVTHLLADHNANWNGIFMA